MNEHNDEKALVLGLSLACPHGLALAECPMTNIRSKPLKERFQAIHAMTEAQHESFATYHSECFRLRGKS